MWGPYREILSPRFWSTDREIIFREISPKSFSQGFPLIFKFSENCPKNYRELPEELITREFYQKRFPKFYDFPKFSENSGTILVDVRFQFCLAAESIGQDGAILQMISQSNCEKAGQDE